MASQEPTVLYEVDGPVATVTMNRPDQANAMNSELIDAIDHCFDRADADAEVRVVILAGAGRHFSSGHDLKELVGPIAGDVPPGTGAPGTGAPGTGAPGGAREPDVPAVRWREMRSTPEGKLRHEQIMYVERCKRIHDFRKPTIAAVQGKCIAAGLMLACMCDIIVASDDASFSNPVLRMTGAGVELLVEPWELGVRKAKEFLLAAEELDASEAWRLGLVNRVVPRAELAQRAHDLASRISLVPPVTAEVVKSSLNYVSELMGKQASWRYHFMAHHWMHNTRTALGALAEREQMGSMKEVFEARDRGDTKPAG